MDSLIAGDPEGEILDEKNGLANSNVATSPQKSKLGVNGFSEPPAPPPSQPLPEKPGLGRAISEAGFHPMLQRADTARPFSSDGEHGNHTQALFVLTHELKAAKDQIPNLQDRVKLLEQQLKEERTARVNAEERAYQLEHGPRKDSAEPTRADSMADSAKKDGEESSTIGTIHEEHSLSDLQIQLDRLQANMSDMKQQMEAYRRRAESAESQRDEARQSLAEMIEEKRARLSEAEKDGFDLKLSRTRSRESGVNFAAIKSEGTPDFLEDANGHTIRPMAPNRTLAVTALLERAGVENQGKPITRQQAVSLQRILRKELLVSADDGEGVEGQGQVKWDSLGYHGIPHAAALTTVVLGLVVMRWLNGWEKMR